MRFLIGMNHFKFILRHKILNYFNYILLSLVACVVLAVDQGFEVIGDGVLACHEVKIILAISFDKLDAQVVLVPFIFGEPRHFFRTSPHLKAVGINLLVRLNLWGWESVELLLKFHELARVILGLLKCGGSWLWVKGLELWVSEWVWHQVQLDHFIQRQKLSNHSLPVSFTELHNFAQLLSSVGKQSIASFEVPLVNCLIDTADEIIDSKALKLLIKASCFRTWADAILRGLVHFFDQVVKEIPHEIHYYFSIVKERRVIQDADLFSLLIFLAYAGLR